MFLSLISSGTLKWLAILVLVFGLVGGAYKQHRKIVEQEKQIALQAYNINQLKQNIKDNNIYLKQMEDISKHKSEIVASLYIERDSLEEKLNKIVKDVDINVKDKHDNQSSKILKDTFKSLGEMK